MGDRFATEITFSMLITKGGFGSCPFPSFQRTGGCATNKKSRSLAAQTGWLVITSRKPPYLQPLSSRHEPWGTGRQLQDRYVVAGFSPRSLSERYIHRPTQNAC